jgi:oligopeptide transport system substrate-binding protein
MKEVLMKLKKATFILALLASGLIAAAGAFAASAWTVVKTAILADPGVVDPGTNWIYEVPHNIFVPLVGYDYVKNAITPRGAASWTVSPDGLVYTFKLQPKWKWSDGTPVTAKDYEYGFQVVVDPASASELASFLFIVKNGSDVNQGKMPVTDLGVKALDASTLQITLTEPAAWFLSSLNAVGYALPKWARDKYGKDWTRPENIVVNGPFKITKWVNDSEVDLTKNPSYYDPASVKIDKMILYVIPSESTALSLYENGDIDTVNVPSTDLTRVQKDPVLKKQFSSTPQLRLTMFRFYTDSPPFDNVNIRKAFAMAVDRDTLVATVTRGNELPAYTMTPPGSIGNVPTSAGIGIKFDAAGAQKLLSDAGYPGGKGFPPIVYGYNASETNARIAQALQKMWQDTLGVQVTLKGVEGGGYKDVEVSGALNIYRQGWGMDFTDAQNLWANLFTSDVTLKGTFVPPNFDNLVKQAAAEQSTAKRKQLYTQIEKLYVQDSAAAVPLFYQTVNVLTKPSLARPFEPSTLEYWTWKVTR